MTKRTRVRALPAEPEAPLDHGENGLTRTPHHQLELRRGRGYTPTSTKRERFGPSASIKTANTLQPDQSKGHRTIKADKTAISCIIL